ncbi:MAG TPA: hypothetical protein VIT68_01405 [Candidatus Gracilibacteria bacterium]
MKKLLIISLLLISSASVQAAYSENQSHFVDPLVSSCEISNHPVCTLLDGKLKTFLNTCEANRAGGQYVHPGECAEFCAKTDIPACAVSRQGVIQNYANACEAFDQKAYILHLVECPEEEEVMTEEETFSSDWPKVDWSYLTPSLVMSPDPVGEYEYQSLRERIEQWRNSNR